MHIYFCFHTRSMQTRAALGQAPWGLESSTGEYKKNRQVACSIHIMATSSDLGTGEGRHESLEELCDNCMQGCSTPKLNAPDEPPPMFIAFMIFMLVGGTAAFYQWMSSPETPEPSSVPALTAGAGIMFLYVPRSCWHLGWPCPSRAEGIRTFLSIRQRILLLWNCHLIGTKSVHESIHVDSHSSSFLNKYKTFSHAQFWSMKTSGIGLTSMLTQNFWLKLQFDPKARLAMVNDRTCFPGML